MSAVPERDIGPLIWVKGEIDASFGRASEALAAFAGSRDGAQLKFAATHMHQAQGALAIVGLEGLTLFSQNLESMVVESERGQVEPTPRNLNLIQRALAFLGTYLDELANGQPDQPLRLWPLFAEIQTARGVAGASPSDLFFPDLTQRPPRRAAGYVPPLTEEAMRIQRAARNRFQRGLLQFLKDGHTGAEQMRDAVADVESCQVMSASRAFWWATLAFLEQQAACEKAADAGVKRLCGRIDGQLRRLLAGSPNVSERLMRDVLYQVAVGPGNSDLARQVRETFRTGGLAQAKDPGKASATPLQPVLRELRDAVLGAKDEWDRFCAGSAVGLPQFEAHTGRMESLAARIGHPLLVGLSGAIRQMGLWLRKAPLQQNEAVAMELATSLLLLENAIENFDRLDESFQPQAEMMIGRLAALQRGETLGPLYAPLLDEMSRHAQERLLMRQVVREIQSNLNQIEQALDNFFRNPEQRGELEGLSSSLKQVEGALYILDQGRAVAVLHECSEKIAAFAAGEGDTEQFDQLANRLSALGFFVASLPYGNADIEALLNPNKVAVGAQEMPNGFTTSDEADSVEQQLEQHKKEAHVLADALKATPQDEGLREKLQQNLEGIRQDANLAGDTRLEAHAGNALSQLAAAPSGSVNLTLAPVAPALPAPSPEAARLAASGAEEIDAELLDIFLEEATEVLGTIRDTLQKSRLQPHAHDLMTTMRRGFHTLKGSGRMVNLKELGEVAWAVEQVMNRWLQQEMDASADLHKLIGDALEVFGRWVAQLQAGGPTGMDARALVAQAERMKSGDTAPQAAPTPVPAPAPAPTPAPALTPAPVPVPPEVAKPTQPPMFELELAPSGDFAVPALPEPTPKPAEPKEPALSLFDEEPFALEFEPVALPAAAPVSLPSLTEATTPLPALDFEFEGVDLHAPLPSLLDTGAHAAALPTEADLASEETIDLGGEDLPFLLELPAAAPPAPPEPVITLQAVREIPTPEVAPAAEPAPPLAEADGEFINLADEDGLDLLDLWEELPPAQETPQAPSTPEFVAEAAPLPEIVEVPEALSELAPIAEMPLVPEVVHVLVPEPILEPVLEPVQIAAPEPAHQTVAELAPIPELAAEPGAAEPLPLLTPDIVAASPAVSVREGILLPLPDHLLSQLRITLTPEVMPAAAIAAVEIEPTVAVEPAVDVEPTVEIEPTVEVEPTVDSLPVLPAVPPQPAVPAVSAVFVPPPRPDAVVIGHLSMSRGLYDSYVDEALARLASLRSELSQAPLMPFLPPTEASFRAAHTLAGISGTVGFTPLQRLGKAVEHALERMAHLEASAAEHLDILNESTVAIERMVTDVACQRFPQEAEDLARRLDALIVVPAQMPAQQIAAPAPVTAIPEEPTQPQAEVAERPEVRLEDDLDEELLPIFLEESVDLLRGIEHESRRWHAFPADGAAPKALARLMHTLKGSARMAGAMGLGEAVHDLESRIETAVASGQPTAEFFEHYDATVDSISHMLDRLRSGEPEHVPEAAPAEMAAVPLLGMPPATPLLTLPAEPIEAAVSQQQATLRVRADLIDKVVNEAGEMSIARARIEGEMRLLHSSLLDLTENVIRLRKQLREIEIQAESQMQSRESALSADHGFDPLEFDRFTRFQELTRMMAESVNDVSTVQHNLLKNLDGADAALLSQSRINRNLAQSLMSVRMVPFNSLATRLHRIVRQTAKELGKKANLDIRGGQVDMDRSVLERVAAPLEHLLRNSITHGIESPEVRAAHGKPDIGQITVTLAQEGNEISILLADDGGGLDFARILQRAVENGLLEVGAQVNEATLTEFIFQSGFSTATRLSEVAGRGVGMDVVKSETASLGGRIDVTSTTGHGTQFRIYLPLTLAVSQALLVSVAGKTYAIPSAMVEQAREIKPAHMQKLLAEGGVDWLGVHYPYHFLTRLFGDSHGVPETEHNTWLLLLRSGSQRIALHVDALKGNQEIVVKNVGPQLARVTGISGATVLGDGEVVLILNAVALAAREAAQGARRVVSKAPAAPVVVAKVPVVMVVDDSLTVRKITSRLLEREGYRVVLAKDGVDALETLLETLPDAMLVDIEMPRMDGFDLTRNIRNDPRLKKVPIIMITSRTAEKHRNYAQEIGVNHYLGKPFREDELLALLRDYTRVAVPA